jgi:hypothetical protein
VIFLSARRNMCGSSWEPAALMHVGKYQPKTSSVGNTWQCLRFVMALLWIGSLPPFPFDHRIRQVSFRGQIRVYCSRNLYR